MAAALRADPLAGQGLLPPRVTLPGAVRDGAAVAPGLDPRGYLPTEGSSRWKEDPGS